MSLLDTLMCILKNSGIISLILLLSSLSVLVITVVFKIITGFIRKSWCQINTDVSVSFDGGASYASNFSYISRKKIFYLKYELRATINGFLPPPLIYKIPFYFEILPQSMEIRVSEYSGICNLDPVKGLVVTTESKFAIYANSKKSEKVKIVLKCERKSTDTLSVFRLVFQNKHLRRYSKTIAFELDTNQ